MRRARRARARALFERRLLTPVYVRIPSLVHAPAPRARAQPGAYSSPCMELPQRTFVRGGRELVVEQRLGSTGSAARRTGIAVWESCAVLTAYLDAAEQREHGRVSGARVLALGSGVGLDVLTAHALGAAAALATDANDEALAFASANAERYSATLDADELAQVRGASGAATRPMPPCVAWSQVLTDALACAVAQRPLGVRRLRWGVFEDVDAVLDGGAYDLLLGSDLTYNPNAWPQLVSTVVTLLEAAEEVRAVRACVRAASRGRVALRRDRRRSARARAP